MVYPPAFERLQIKYMNPMVKRISRFMPGVATIKHRGRKSGKAYETVVTPFRKGNTLAVVLGHGKTDWVKNGSPPARPTCSSASELCTSSTHASCRPVATPQTYRSPRACRREKWECSSPTSRDTLSR